MAVLGAGFQWNKDPAKMPKWCHAKRYVGHNYVSTTFNYGDNYTFTNASEFFTHITSNAVANVHRTIVNISGKSGWLTFCQGPGAAGQVTTFIITVDGVATTIEVAADATNQVDTQSDHAGFLGAHFRCNGTNSTSAVYGQAHVAAQTQYGTGYLAWNPEHTTINRGGFADVATTCFILDPLLAIHQQPSSCVRFEDSLTVTVAGSVGQTNDYKHSNVMYVLES